MTGFLLRLRGGQSRRWVDLNEQKRGGCLAWQVGGSGADRAGRATARHFFASRPTRSRIATKDDGLGHLPITSVESPGPQFLAETGYSTKKKKLVTTHHEVPDERVCPQPLCSLVLSRASPVSP